MTEFALGLEADVAPTKHEMSAPAGLIDDGSTPLQNVGGGTMGGATAPAKYAYPLPAPPCSKGEGIAHDAAPTPVPGVVPGVSLAKVVMPAVPPLVHVGRSG